MLWQIVLRKKKTIFPKRVCLLEQHLKNSCCSSNPSIHRDAAFSALKLQSFSLEQDWFVLLLFIWFWIKVV